MLTAIRSVSITESWVVWSDSVEMRMSPAISVLGVAWCRSIDEANACA